MKKNDIEWMQAAPGTRRLISTDGLVAGFPCDGDPERWRLSYGVLATNPDDPFGVPLWWHFFDWFGQPRIATKNWRRFARAPENRSTLKTTVTEGA